MTVDRLKLIAAELFAADIQVSAAISLSLLNRGFTCVVKRETEHKGGTKRKAPLRGKSAVDTSRAQKNLHETAREPTLRTSCRQLIGRDANWQRALQKMHRSRPADSAISAQPRSTESTQLYVKVGCAPFSQPDTRPALPAPRLTHNALRPSQPSAKWNMLFAHSSLPTQPCVPWSPTVKPIPLIQLLFAILPYLTSAYLRHTTRCPHLYAVH